MRNLPSYGDGLVRMAGAACLDANGNARIHGLLFKMKTLQPFNINEMVAFVPTVVLFDY